MSKRNDILFNGFAREEVFELVRADIMSLREYCMFFNAPFSTMAWMRRKVRIKKQDLQRWTPIQVKWLLILYPFVGDAEIAQIFNEAYHKEKGWTLKHIEKKRVQMGLKRSKEQLKAIRERNRLFGCWMLGTRRSKVTMGVAPVGEVRVWKGREYIKTKSGFETYARYLWSSHFGEIPAGMNITKKDQSKPTTIDNLEMITDGDLGIRNKLSCYPDELRKSIITLKKLSKAIYEKQTARPEQSPLRAA